MKISKLKDILTRIMCEHGDIEVVASEAGPQAMNIPYISNEYYDSIKQKFIKIKCVVIEAKL